MQTLLQDLRFALRQILRSPGFSLTAVLSLTLGIGATVAVYSILYDAVLHPWPYAGMDRICQIWITDKAGHDRVPGLTGPQIRQIRLTQAADEVLGVDGWNLTVTGSDVPEDVSAVMLTGNGFQFFGLPALLGRSDITFDFVLEAGAAGSKDVGRIVKELKKQLPTENGNAWQRSFPRQEKISRTTSC